MTTQDAVAIAHTAALLARRGGESLHIVAHDAAALHALAGVLHRCDEEACNGFHDSRPCTRCNGSAEEPGAPIEDDGSHALCDDCEGIGNRGAQQNVARAARAFRKVHDTANRYALFPVRQRDPRGLPFALLTAEQITEGQRGDPRANPLDHTTAGHWPAWY